MADSKIAANDAAQTDPIDAGLTALERAMQSRADYLRLKAQTERARQQYEKDVRDLRLITRQLDTSVAA